MLTNGSDGIKRTDDITLHLPGGGSIRASGTLVVLLIVVVAGFGLLFYAVNKHDSMVVSAQKETTQSVEDLMCILTLSPDERVEARRGASLSRWCVFLKVSEARR